MKRPCSPGVKLGKEQARKISSEHGYIDFFDSTMQMARRKLKDGWRISIELRN